jgi:hypothetical protein
MVAASVFCSEKAPRQHLEEPSQPIEMPLEQNKGFGSKYVAKICSTNKICVRSVSFFSKPQARCNG